MLFSVPSIVPSTRPSSRSCRGHVGMRCPEGGDRGGVARRTNRVKGGPGEVPGIQERSTDSQRPAQRPGGYVEPGHADVVEAHQQPIWDVAVHDGLLQRVAVDQHRGGEGIETWGTEIADRPGADESEVELAGGHCFDDRALDVGPGVGVLPLEVDLDLWRFVGTTGEGIDQWFDAPLPPRRDDQSQRGGVGGRFGCPGDGVNAGSKHRGHHHARDRSLNSRSTLHVPFLCILQSVAFRATWGERSAPSRRAVNGRSSGGISAVNMQLTATGRPANAPRDVHRRSRPCDGRR